MPPSLPTASGPHPGSRAHGMTPARHTVGKDEGRILGVRPAPHMEDQPLETAGALGGGTGDQEERDVLTHVFCGQPPDSNSNSRSCC